MDQLVIFTKSLRIQPVSNRHGDTTNLYDHFIAEDDATRLERDTIKFEVEQNHVVRGVNFRFLPQIVRTEENRDLL